MIHKHEIKRLTIVQGLQDGSRQHRLRWHGFARYSRYTDHHQPGPVPLNPTQLLLGGSADYERVSEAHYKPDEDNSSFSYLSPFLFLREFSSRILILALLLLD